MPKLPSIAFGIILLLIGSSGLSYAQPRIAVLDFELEDMTALPNTPLELARTASFRPLLEQGIKAGGGQLIDALSLQQQREANPGFGYLYIHHDAAASLGKTLGADWIVVGRHTKPSFLYSYLQAQVVRVESGHASRTFVIELKGNHVRVSERGAAKLADAVVKYIAQNEHQKSP